VNDTATQNKECDYDHEGRGGCQNGPTQCFVDAGIHHFFEASSPETAKIFPYPVKDDNGIIQGIPHDGQEGSYYCEGYFSIGQGKGPHSNDDVMD
jgi:hypothetical protein